MTVQWQITVVLAACAVVVMAATTPSTSFDDSTPEAEEDIDEYTPFMGQRFDGFDWQLCKALDKKDPGNMVVSPISVKLVLAMLYEGAAGATAREIMTTLQLPINRQQMRGNFSSILASLQVTRPEYVLDIGTRLYADERTKIRKLYEDILKTYYNSAIEPINFSNSEAAANKINSWVDAVTHGRIKNLVTDAESMSSKVMLLVNAIFFKGLWRFPFNPEATVTGTFHVTPTKNVVASYMTMSQNLYYMEVPDISAKILRLPYQGKKFAMFIVLPNSPTGLKHLSTTINPFILHRHLWLMSNVAVNVTLPKFSFKYTSELGDVLKELGIRQLFQNLASLPGIVNGRQGNDRLYVSDVLQKAGLAVDEQGTEAYAATDVSIVNKIGDDDVYTFNATHPFMFFIEDETTGTVIFVGKLVDPSNLEVAPTYSPPSTRPPTPVTRSTTGRPIVRPQSPSSTAKPSQRQPFPPQSDRDEGSSNGPKLSSTTSGSTTPALIEPDETEEMERNENVEHPQTQGGNINSRIGGSDNDHSRLYESPQRNQARGMATGSRPSTVWKELYKDRLNN